MARSVAVLMGGWSEERDVSLSSGRQIAAALDKAGFDVRTIDVIRDLRVLLDHLEPLPDVIFNALHGRYGEDGCIQGVLECLGVPYTHSGVLASALGMDKPMAKQLFEAAGIPCPPHRIATRHDGCWQKLSPPFVIKPLNQGSSVGVEIVRNEADLAGLDDRIWGFGERIMIESYIPGRELTVSVLGDRALGVTEIRPRGRFYDYRSKYSDGQADHLLPAPIPDAVFEAAMTYAVRAHDVLGCRGASRSDFRFDDSIPGTDGLHLLEVNTQPGMTPLSLVPEAAAQTGLSFVDLVCWMVEQASCDG